MIGEKVREWRLAHGWTQSELADRMFVSVSTVRFLETGRQHPTEDTFEALSSVFKMSVKELKGIE